jgi:hypothetical protein
MCEEEVNTFCRDARLLLENDKGETYEPTSVHIVVNQTLFETARLLVKYKYAGDFSGSCTLVVKLGGGKRARLDLGPADCDFYRTGTVTAEIGIDVRVAPNDHSTVVCTVGPGEKVYFTGRISFFWPDEDHAWYYCVDYEEVLFGETRGWAVSYDNTKWIDYRDKHGKEAPEGMFVYIKEGPFAARPVKRGRAEVIAGEEEGSYE